MREQIGAAPSSSGCGAALRASNGCNHPIIRVTLSGVLSLQILPSPLEQHVSVDIVAARDQRHRRTRLQGLLDQLPLELGREVWAPVRTATGAPIQCLVHIGFRNNLALARDDRASMNDRLRSRCSIPPRAPLLN